MRREWQWSAFQLNKLSVVKSVIEDLNEYLPLTLRQIYYALVGAGNISNKRSEYNQLSQLLSNARYDGLLPWDIIEDRSRRFIDLTGYRDPRSFIDNTIDSWLSWYSRDLLQDQDTYIEIWTEKDALSTLFQRVAQVYTVPVVVCRGFISTTFINAFYKRTQGRNNVIVLYLGDYDPSGMYMTVDIPQRLERHGNFENVWVERVALNPGDPRKYSLPESIDSIKVKDTRTEWFLENYGAVGYELDALLPSTLEDLTRNAIESQLDMDAYLSQLDLYSEERARIGAYRNKLLKIECF